MTTAPTTTQISISALEAVDAIAAAGGNQEVAAERLKLTRNQLAGIIASDPLAVRRLSDQLRVITLLDTQYTLEQVGVAVRGSLVTLESKDLVTLLGRLTEAMAKLTDDRTTTSNQTNTFEFIMRSLPPEVREALSALTAPSASDDPLNSTDSSYLSHADFADPAQGRVQTVEDSRTIDAEFQVSPSTPFS